MNTAPRFTSEVKFNRLKQLCKTFKDRVFNVVSDLFLGLCQPDFSRSLLAMIIDYLFAVSASVHLMHLIL